MSAAATGLGHRTSNARMLHRPAVGRPRYRLVCLHHAGGGPAAFAPWLRMLPDDVEIYALRMPGRDSRLGELQHRKPAAAVAEFLGIVGPLATDDVPVAYYGHSMGGALAYELYRALAEKGAPEPLYLAVGATAAPQRWASLPARLPEGDARQVLVDLLRAYGGTPPEVFDHPELLDVALTVLEGDFRLYDDYRPTLPPGPVGCPLVAFAGARDGMVATDDVRAWRECAAGPFAFHLLDDSHFFVESQADRILELLGDWAPMASKDTGAAPVTRTCT
ncbi:thioesterase II family protein [Streptomyces fuscichromogenes]|uniref:Non-ribosomal peptide synthase n=1 Tax=Streptomyces fuscichromogenes TaxID=1324013 RepID=A0A918CXJ6_9ACTN|nr:thioesterase [Streptomyces fuscichromogenes]GGN43775.1 non-ribosomal peptide synthase [Streptomyces fuscichromogenes]